MKPALLLACLFIQSISFGQLAFEEVTPPNDFSMSAVRKSPQGEYFMQLINDKKSIYTSTNGLDWTRASLPLQHTMTDVLFFSDGTPLLHSEVSDHLVRRNGQWYSLDVGSNWDNVETSFIKDDTLFAYQDNVFAYSINKGESFTTAFTYDGFFPHSASLWKFEAHYVMHHTSGALDSLSIFTQDGTRIAKYGLNLGSGKVTYNACGEILFTDSDRFYRLREQGLNFSTGLITTVVPQGFSDNDLQSQNGNYYIRQGERLYVAHGCAYDWQLLFDHPLLDTAQYVWVGDGETVLIYTRNMDSFYEESTGNNTWNERQPQINYASIVAIDEAIENFQVALTSNAIFNKLNTEPEWTENNSHLLSNYFQVQYSPDGDLYVNRRFDIQYSTDNGQTFTTIALPPQIPFDLNYRMEVLDDEVLFIYDDLFHDGYYTVNNGVEWKPALITTYFDIPLVKLVDNYILIASLDYQYAINRINIETDEVTMHSIGDYYNIDYYGNAMQDDGTIYFQGFDVNNPVNSGLHRYRIGQAPEFIGEFEDDFHYGTLIASGIDLYSFESNKYYVLEGDTIARHSYDGLPSTGVKRFILANNEYLYVIIDNHRIFRSTTPLSHKKFISGSVYHDRNGACDKDTLDPRLQYWQVKIENDVFLRVKNTNPDGEFAFDVPFGTYTLSTRPVSNEWEVCESTYQVTIDENNTAVSQDFLASGLEHCANLEIDFSTPLLRRCFENYYTIRVRNTGPAASLGTKLRLELDPYFVFISATLPHTQVEDHVLEFDLGILEVNDEVVFQVLFTLSCDAELGSEHCLKGTLSDDILCGESRSSYTECQENIGSYDPNDKRVFNEAGQETERVDKGEYIYYHIRFQNTGTDTAFTVRIDDPLSPMLDYSTLEMLSASHPYSYLLTDGPSLSILFENIFLPDSNTNEPASHGFVKFRIKPLAAFDYGTSIPNTAGIYFDFNDPVLTNEAVLVILPTVKTIDAELLLVFDVFPNPAHTSIQLNIAAEDRNRIDSYEIVDLLGKVAYHSGVLNGNAIPVAQLTPGMYAVLVKEDGVIIGMKKFVRL